jgi:hypothetical protein
MTKIEIIGGKYDLVLIEAALCHLADKLNAEGDKYNSLDDVFSIIEQVEYIKATWEDN